MMKQDNIDLSRLLDLIERYYDCSLSDEEERSLRHTVATTTLSHPAIDEARALMGFRRPAATAQTAGVTDAKATPEASATRKSSRHAFSFRSAISIAAAAAVLITLAVNFLRPSEGIGDYGQTCIAYVNGTRITDEDDVIRLIAEDMSEFDDGSQEAAESFRDELDDVADIIDNYESEIIFPEI